MKEKKMTKNKEKTLQLRITS